MLPLRRRGRMSARIQSEGSWWRTLTLEVGETAVGTLEDFRLGLHRGRCEWLVWHGPRVEDDEALVWRASKERLEDRPSGTLNRHVFRETEGEACVCPALADRPVVVRPMTELAVPPGEEAVIYVSTPLWVRVELLGPKVVLLDVPVSRPSDTWFGSSTRHGEICYSSVTRARLQVSGEPPRNDRALTEVRVLNRAPATLPMSRLSLPVPYLSLFPDDEGNLWTESVTLEHADVTDFATLQIGEGPAGVRREPLTDPRRAGGRGALVRAFSALLRSF